MRTFLLLLGVAGALCDGQSRAVEPVSPKPTVSSWQKKLQDPNMQVRQSAVEALGKLGTEAKAALPDLEKLVRADIPPAMLGAVAVALAGIDPESSTMPQVVRLLVKTPTPIVRCRSGPPPSLAVQFYHQYPDLTLRHAVKLLEDKETLVRQEAAGLLGEVHSGTQERAGEALLKALKDTDPGVRAIAVRSLSQVASGKIRQAIPVVLKLLEARLFDGYGTSAIFKSYAAEMCPLLIRALDGKSAAEQAELASALYHFRATSLPLLVAALDDPATPIRRGAIAVLTQIGPDARTAIPKLVELTGLQRGCRVVVRDTVTPLDAVEALLRVDPAFQSLPKWRSTVETLVLRHNPVDQNRAVSILRRVGPAAKPAAPTLLAAMNDSTGELRVYMALTLIELDRAQDAKALPIFLNALKAPVPARQWEVVRALAEIGPLAKDALPDLRKLLQEKKSTPEQRLAVATTLTRIDRREIAACLPVVLEPLQQGRRRVGRDLDRLILLTTWGAEARPAAPVMRKLVTTPDIDPGIQMGAAVALVLLGADENEIGMKAIRAVVRDREEEYGQYQLLHILGRLGPLGKPLAPVVRPLLRDARLGQETRMVLAKMEPKAAK
jgi:HEAT repeat protein